MKQLTNHPNWSRWANIAVIIAGMWVLLIVMWSPEAAGPREQQVEVDSNAAWFYALAASGPLALAAVFVALRSAILARVVLGVAALSLFAGLIGFRAFGTLAWSTVIIPGLIMLVAIPFLGAMPTPEDEGQVRHGLGDPGERDAVDPERSEHGALHDRIDPARGAPPRTGTEPKR
jgi:hypothetical protein